MVTDRFRKPHTFYIYPGHIKDEHYETLKQKYTSEFFTKIAGSQIIEIKTIVEIQIYGDNSPIPGLTLFKVPCNGHWMRVKNSTFQRGDVIDAYGHINIPTLYWDHCISLLNEESEEVRTMLEQNMYERLLKQNNLQKENYIILISSLDTIVSKLKKHRENTLKKLNKYTHWLGDLALNE